MVRVRHSQLGNVKNINPNSKVHSRISTTNTTGFSFVLRTEMFGDH